MLWKEYIAVEFNRFICKEEHFLYLNGKTFCTQKLQNLSGNLSMEIKKL